MEDILIIMVFLMDVKMTGVTIINLDLFIWFPKIYYTWVFVTIKAIKNILELGGYPDHHDLPDGCQDDWSHHHQSGFALRFPKIYDTWVFVAIKAIKNIHELGGHS